VLIDLAERGPGAGVYLVWIASATERLPARSELFLAADPRSGSAEAGIIDGGVRLLPVDTEGLGRDELVHLARSLAPVVDAGAGRDEAGELPSRVSFLEHMGLDLITSPTGVVERWQASDSLPATGVPRRRRPPLHALVGATATGAMTIDLRTQGPHALVGGTTGSGKSEFLQSWVLGLAVNHSPARVTFLLVDYKGGSAFSGCTHLPHTVGLVTDLTPHLVARALRSLNAELRHREHILDRKRAKDVMELELRGDPDCPPSLVIVVDEFAALVAEVPDFVDGMVNIGRSLGLHLVLATQRPAGVIRDNLRANTNLRVALRMADEADSTDVVGTKVAAGFDPGQPGRAVLKAGPGRLVPFQAAYVGGWTTGEAPPPKVAVRELRLGAGPVWEEPATGPEQHDADPGPNDLHRLVDAVGRAAVTAGVPAPRKPWLPELAVTYDLARIPQSRTDHELVFAVADDPDNQRQVPVAFHPDVDGNLAVVGTGGTGKTTLLRTLAVAAGLSVRGGPCHVYGLDFGSRGLHLLDALPHVGSIVSGDDDERVKRLLRTLRATVDERAERYAAVRAGSITEYRAMTGHHDEPRLLLLVDGFGAFRQAYEAGPRLRIFDQFASLVADGRQVGVHVALTADRPASIPSALGSMIPRRLALRMASEGDALSAGVDAEALAGAPPGRGFLDGSEIQVAVLGGSASTADQAAAVQALADDLVAKVPRPPAPTVGRLPELVRLGELPPVDAAGRPTVGVGDEDLGPLGVSFEDPLLVVGPPRSGRTSALATLALALRRARSAGTAPWMVYVGDGRSGLRAAVPFDESVVTGADFEDRLVALAKRLVEEPHPGAVAVFIDNAPRLAALPQEPRVADVVDAAVRSGQIVVADGETAAMGSSWGVLKVLKAARHGLALVPDQFDGDAVFKTPFPPLQRADYPPGRAIYVARGRLARLQVALPDIEA
jgi:S-DNA-T family DNA segregation ATPase FtsK/SpoIIIE